MSWQEYKFPWVQCKRGTKQQAYKATGQQGKRGFDPTGLQSNRSMKQWGYKVKGV